jgi:ferritin-like metal-binding protein YciE
MAKKRKSRSGAKESPNLQELLVMELQNIHSAENQLSRVLPRLAKSIQSEALRAMTEERVSEGERVINEVETALEQLDESPGRAKNVAAEGLITDLREQIQQIAAGPALDAVVISGLQKTEHYCIAAWGTVKALAKTVGEDETVEAMKRALKEGKRMDERLTELAEQEVISSLLEEGSDEEGDEETDLEAGSRRSKRQPNSDKSLQR